ncbi:MAG: hypothetical protein Q7T84_10080 [Phenylobacterium sp.]|uniref:hypothetical protein n=1 Tax=Phenylobacterium sp. TaxID=1871053 RepID=UPI002716A25E|nr:hypothetical protein [Phenylobacterium sp.]MDO9431638.1 hypothetical protein [Phenylobacterium sp.]
MTRVLIWPLAVALASVATGASAADPSFCCGRKLAMTFVSASPDVQLVTVLLWAVVAASFVVWLLALRRLRREPGLGAPRSLAFLAAWRVGGPLLGAAVAAKVQSEFWVAIYAYPPVTDYMREAFGPSLAEFWMLLWAGLMAGAIAALTHAHLAGRLAAAAITGRTT